MKKKDIVKTASEDWSHKWTLSVLTYVRSLKSKTVKAALKAVELKFVGGSVYSVHFLNYLIFVKSVVQVMKRKSKKELCTF